MKRVSLFAFLITLFIINGCFSEERFISSPPSLIYAVKGTEVFFNWTYTSASGVTALVKNWYQSDSSGNAIGNLIMTEIVGSVSVLKAGFAGRTTYVQNAGMLLKNVTLTDEGYIACSIQYSNGHTHKSIVRLIVTIAPTVGLKLPSQRIVMVDTLSTVSCQFDARPSPTVKWYLDGKEMSASRYIINTTTIGVFNDTTRIFTTLTINVSKPEDNGVIMCAAALPNGNVSSSMSHIVYYPPQDTSFTTSRVDDIGELGMKTLFTCKAKGNPTVSYEIYKEGSLLTNTSSGVYTINSTSIEDKGTYSCTPVNYLGRGPEMVVNFTVNISPRLQSHSGNMVQTVLSSPLTIYCIFYGQPVPNITWEEPGGLISPKANISSETISSNISYTVLKSKLQFDKVEKSDHGTYNCFAKNSAGSLGQNISVDVQYSAEFRTSLNQNYTLIEKPASNSSWTCIADGNPGLTVTWYVNGMLPGEGYLVQQKTRNLFNGAQVESTISFVGTTRDKASRLSCNATNAVGNVQSSSDVIINYPPSSSLPMSMMKAVTLGNSISLVCQISSQPHSDLYWEKDGVLLNTSSHTIVTRVVQSNIFRTILQSNLSFSSAKKIDDGSYNCISINSIGNLTQNTYLHVNYMPEFIIPLAPRSLVLEDTRNHAIECIVRSKPASSITWTKNGSVIQASNDTKIQILYNTTQKISNLKSTLIFAVIEKEFYGNYSCIAKNGVGNVSSEQLLIVTYKPFIVAASKRIIYINASETVKLFCDMQSSPVLSSLIWLSNNQPIKAANHLVSISTLFMSSQQATKRIELTIANATRFDSAVYECRGGNKFGNATANTTLVVNYAPLITKTLNVEYTKYEGSAFNLSCQFISNPGALVYWKFNGTKINNAASGYNVTTTHSMQIDRVTTNTTLSIPNLRRTMHGHYECIAENHQGSLSRMATVIVNYEPSFTSSNVPKLELNTGGSTTLTCQVDSNPASNITWLKDNKVLSNSSKTMISTSIIYSNKFKAKISSTLRLNMVAKNDTGNYSCRANNEVATKYQTSRVIVKYPPQLTNSFPVTQNITESSSHTNFTCQAESHPVSKILWYKNGSIYNSNIHNTVTLQTDSKSIIVSELQFPTGVKRTDFGIYSCNASNDVGNATFTTDVTVWYGPEFHANLTGQLDVFELSNASFQCQTEGYPGPSIQWQKVGKTLNSSEHQIQTSVVLSSANKVVMRSVISFTKVTAKDTASYTCLAKSIAGSRQHTKRLNVQFLPKLVVPSANLTVNNTNSISLHCATNANPTVTRYIWRKNGTALSETGSTYRISSAQLSSTGLYSCVAINSLGSSPAMVFKLLVNVPPTFTKQAECIPNTVISKMVCECAGTGVPLPSVYWTKGQSKVIIGRSNVYEKKLASNDVDGKYTCYLQNILQTVTSSTGFYYNVKLYNDWTAWAQCNATCGNGYQTRQRDCNFPPCDQSSLIAYKNCTGACPPESLKKDEAWAIALYVLIPIIVVLLFIILLWIARTKRRKEEESPVVIPVYGHLSKPPSTRSISTRRDIYLPEANFGTVNSAYLEEKETPQKEKDFFYSVKEDDYENKEEEIRFDEEYPLDSSTDDAEDIQQLSPKSSEDASMPDAHVLHVSGTSVDSPEDQGATVDTQEGNPQNNKDTQPTPDVPYAFYNEMITAL